MILPFGCTLVCLVCWLAAMGFDIIMMLFLCANHAQSLNLRPNGHKTNNNNVDCGQIDIVLFVISCFPWTRRSILWVVKSIFFSINTSVCVYEFVSFLKCKCWAKIKISSSSDRIISNFDIDWADLLMRRWCCFIICRSPIHTFLSFKLNMVLMHLHFDWFIYWNSEQFRMMTFSKDSLLRPILSMPQMHHVNAIHKRKTKCISSLYFVIILFNLRWLSWNPTIGYTIISMLFTKKKSEQNVSLSWNCATVHSDAHTFPYECAHVHALCVTFSRSPNHEHDAEKKNVCIFIHFLLLLSLTRFSFLFQPSFLGLFCFRRSRCCCCRRCCCWFFILSLWLFCHFICVFYEPCIGNNSVAFAEKYHNVELNAKRWAAGNGIRSFLFSFSSLHSI